MINEVFVWESYSCNNSSDYRLVAEFKTPKGAEAMAKELTAFFKKHAKAFDEANDDPDFDWPGEGTDVARAFGKKYGHKWVEALLWGDDSLEGDEPVVSTLGNALLLFHSYCSGGLGFDLEQVLKKAGATLPEKGSESGPPILYAELTLPSGKSRVKLEEELTTFFEQRSTSEYTSDWEELAETQIEPAGDVEEHTFVKDGDRVAFTIAIRPDEIPILQKYLAKRKAEKVSLRIATKGDLKRNNKRASELATIAKKAAHETEHTRKAVGTLNPAGKSFLFTGKLAAMKRDEAAERVRSLGGKLAGTVTKNLDVLVVGDDGSPLYGGGTKGDKQRKAEELIAAGAKIHIMSESAFLRIKGGAAKTKRPRRSR